MNFLPRSFSRSAQRLFKVFLILLAAFILIFLAVRAKTVQAATIVVTTINDSGAGSLREAIATAAVSDTIEFDAALSGQTIVLSSQISISQDAKIYANVPITLSGGQTTRLFYMEPDDQGVHFEIDGLTLMHGGTITEDGGAIYMDSGLLTIKNSTFYSNTADDGGAIYVYEGGTVYIYTSTLKSNLANNDGGAVHASGPLHIKDSRILNNQANHDAGGLYSTQGVVKLDNTELYSNTALNEGGAINAYYANVLLENQVRVENNHANSNGGGIYAYHGSLAIDNSQIISNTSDNTAGGIYADSLGILVENSTVSWNSAVGTAGGIFIDYWSVISNTTVSHNSSNGYGGGVEAYYGLHVENSTFEGNDSNDNDGGAIYACGSDYGYVSIVGSTFQDNRGDDGGAIYGYYSCGVQIQSSSFISNVASSSGGAIFTYEYNNLVVDRSTFYDNRSDDDGGAIYSADSDGVANISQSTFSNNSSGGDGGALYLYYGGTIQHSTIVSNTAEGDGGGLYEDRPTLIENSIIAGNTVSGTLDHPYADCSFNDSDPKKNTFSGGYNITGVATGCALFDARDQHIETGTLFVDVLAPLADNGGGAKTHMPLPNSPAIDGAPSLTCPITDQRGEARNQGEACDIGAVESSETGTVPTVSENVITVTTFDDEYNTDADCSLREAVSAANLNIAVDACPAGQPYSTTVDVIQLAAGEYFVTSTSKITQSFTITYIDSFPVVETVTEIITPTDNSNLADDLDIIESLTIRGAGMGLTTINGGESNRIFHVDPLDPDQVGIYLLLEDMKLTHGSVEDPDYFSYCCDVWVDGVYVGQFDRPDEPRDGGAIFLEAGKLVLNRVDVVDNFSDDHGGAIYAEYGVVYLIDGTTIRNNYSDEYGGAVYAEYAVVNVFDSMIRDNESDSYGGGIYSEYGTVLIDHSNLKSNLTDEGGGGVYAENGIIVVRNGSLFDSNYAAGEAGGGIQPQYSGAWVENSTFRDNFSVPNDYDGGAINAEDTAIVIKNSLFEGNYGESGGAIDTEHGGLILNSIFRDNHAGDYGGAIYVEDGVLVVRDSIFEDNDAVEYGGAIYGEESSVDIHNTVFRNNKVLAPGYAGGAIYTEEYNGLTLRHTAFIGNQSNGDGGAIYADDNSVIVENSTFDSNTARGDGGGAIFDDYPADILNSTFSNNSAGDEGGALRLYVGTNINFSTIVGNQSSNGGAVFYYDDSYHNVIQNSIVAGNSVNSRLPATLTNCLEGSGITSNGHNVFEANTGCYETSSDQLIVATDLFVSELFPLADNDGHVLPDGSVIQTYALRGTSVAKNNGDLNSEILIDQRGVARPEGVAHDIGAYELINVAPVAIDDPNIMTDEGEGIVISPLSNDEDPNADILMLSISVSPTNGTATISGTQVTYLPDMQFFGTDSFSYSLSDGEFTDTATVTVTVAQTSWEIYFPFTTFNE